MGNIDDEVITIIKRLARTISKVGVRKVVAALDELNSEEGFIEAHNSLIKFITKETSVLFKVKPTDLKKKNIRGIPVEARSMCFILIKKHLDYKHADIAGIFGSRNHSLVSSALKTFKKTESQKNILWVKYS